MRYLNYKLLHSLSKQLQINAFKKINYLIFKGVNCEMFILTSNASAVLGAFPSHIELIYREVYG